MISVPEKRPAVFYSRKGGHVSNDDLSALSIWDPLHKTAFAAKKVRRTLWRQFRTRSHQAIYSSYVHMHVGRVRRISSCQPAKQEEKEGRAVMGDGGLSELATGESKQRGRI